jgi:cobalt/nickel transport protein
MLRTLFSAFLVFLFSAPAFAHFQVIYTPEMARERGGTLDFKMVFTHPFEAGHTMAMGEPQEFYMIHKEQKTDLMDTLSAITWGVGDHAGAAYEATGIKARSMGDYVFALVPEPYMEAEEDIYIQQLTKLIINNVGLPTDWNAPSGLKTEIMPLDKPYALWTGNVFRGVVMSEGEPVPHAEIEVEYLNHPPVPDKNEFQAEGLVAAPQGAFVTQGILADENGKFTFGIPKAGWWGFCALGSGPDKEYNGKELSQDAVLWIQAKDMN